MVQVWKSKLFKYPLSIYMGWQIFYFTLVGLIVFPIGWIFLLSGPYGKISLDSMDKKKKVTNSNGGVIVLPIILNPGDSIELEVEYELGLSSKGFDPGTPMQFLEKLPKRSLAPPKPGQFVWRGKGTINVLVGSKWNRLNIDLPDNVLVSIGGTKSNQSTALIDGRDIQLKKADAIRRLSAQINRIESLTQGKRFSSEFTQWQRDCRVAIEYIFGRKPNYQKDFEKIRYYLVVSSNLTTEEDYQRAYIRGLDEAKAILNSMIEEVKEYWSEIAEEIEVSSPKSDSLENTAKSKQPLAIFYSFAAEDDEIVKELDKHFALLKRTGIVSSWNFRKITGGLEWKGEIDKNIGNAKIILLLISPDFINSDYCFDVEMKKAIKMHEDKLARVVPIILRPCDWHEASFGKLQALPKDGKPITIWSNRDEAFLDTAKGIRKICEELGNISG